MKIAWLLIILGLSQVLGLETWEPLIGPNFASRTEGQLISKGNFGVFKSNKKNVC